MPARAWRMTPILLGLALGACATAPAQQHLNANLITRAEIEEQGPSSVYDLIQKIRPNWLNVRHTSFTQDTNVWVYLDGTRMGGPEALRQVSTSEVEKLEFLDARRATARFGSGHVNGAILITTPG